MTLFVGLSNPLQRGFTSHYYDNVEWTGAPLLTGIDHAFDLRKMAYEFPAREYDYGIQWTGVLAIPTSGMYQFTTISDDGSEIVINDQRIVDNRGFHYAVEQTGTVQLEKGFHPIEIRYMQRGGMAELEVYWTKPGGDRELFSSAPLFVKGPSDLSNFWIYRIYQIRNIVFLLLVVFGSVLTSMLIIGASVQISRKFPFWMMESHGIAGLILFLIVYRLVYVLLDAPFDGYAFLRYFLCFLIIGFGMFVFIGIALSVCQNLYQTWRCKHAERGWQKSSGNIPSHLSMNAPKYSNYLVVLLFVIYFLLAAGIFDDYGISFDEPLSRRRGFINYHYIFEENHAELINYESKYHGPVFDLLLVFLEKGLHLEDIRDIYLMRHLVTFLLFYTGTFFFYLLCKKRFGDGRIALFGSLFLILSPRIFADAFYNPKDIPFLSLFIISIYTLIQYIEKQTWLRASVHALLCGLLIGMRVLGVLVPCFTFLLVAGDLLLGTKTRKNIQQTLFTLLLYGFLVVAFTTLFFPILWEGPIHHFILAFKEMRWYPWGGGMLYLGKYILATDLPWHYILVWILITTPFLYTFHFIVGLFVSLKSFLGSPCHFYCDIRKNYDLVYFLWFFVPIFMIILLKSVVYDAWRHLFFVYPAFLMIALKGFVSIFQGIRSTFSGRQTYKIVGGIYMLIILLGVFGPTYFMVRHHPYQHVYFNQLAGKNMASVKKDFDLDYWGLSYRQAFEYILQHDSREKIRICVPNFSVEYIAEIFPINERKRLSPAEWLEDADYFVSNYRAHKEEYPYENEVYSIKIGGAKIMVVYKLNNFSVDSVE
jgi:hypothetical protein